MPRENSKKYKVPNLTESLGHRLKKRRSDHGFSLSDVGDMTGFSTSTIVDLENGVTVDINYYIAYAQTLNYKLTELFDLKIEYGPRFRLSTKKEARIFITDNVKKLYTEYDFFAEGRTVSNVAEKLLALNVISEITPFIRTRISGTLLGLVDEKMLFVSEKQGRKNLYKKLNH